ncbi:DJ-1/PfpI family protein [Chitinophaga arvensicola]|uniref:4-methyl-5(B-hydroxyethyl)-thiazole monophosphate biosynthesis n=1 Tax=Chitinophaga arvensicola TaxID=29529 RepID=A0A1I0RS54_9BACT|nr:DJ-1/PfpI family protein [Chitinophaga arvensicola]SEW44019.1 4-methyl-5(b-hydroxyethyl)-thiazole monophosphate biosynthesis [Chitinophaga arvensicola]
MKKVLLLLADGFEMFEASVFIDVIGWNLVDGDGTTSLYSVGLQREVTSTFKQRVLVDYTTDEVNVSDFDALAIPGGFAEYGFYEHAYDERFLALIRQFEAQQKPITTICTGAFPVAKSGILHGRRGTTYNLNPVRQQTLKGLGVNVVNEAIVTDGNIVTSWNPSTALDVAFLLLEKLTSPEQADKIRTLMGFK